MKKVLYAAILACITSSAAVAGATKTMIQHSDDTDFGVYCSQNGQLVFKDSPIRNVFVTVSDNGHLQVIEYITAQMKYEEQFIGEGVTCRIGL